MTESKKKVTTKEVTEQEDVVVVKPAKKVKEEHLEKVLEEELDVVVEDEKAKLPERLDKSIEIVYSFALAGLNNTMNEFNGK